MENMASPRYIKSHLPWDLLPEQMSTVKPRVRAERARDTINQANRPAGVNLL